MASRVLVALRVRASPERAFAAFTQEIERWWRPNGLFPTHPDGTGRLAFEPGEGGRLTERLATGGAFEIGRITTWDPPRRIVFGWRQHGFAPDQRTEVRVRFDPAGAETRITVEHLGWDAIPREHASRHGFPLHAFQARLAEWWRELLGELDAVVER